MSVYLKEIIFYAIIALLCCSCTLSDRDVTTHKWTYLRGDRLEDSTWINAESFGFGAGVFKLSHDTIFLIDTAIALIIDRNKGLFSDQNRIKIKSLKTGKTAYYRDSGPLSPGDTTYETKITQIDLKQPPIPDPPLPPVKIKKAQ